MIYFFVGDDRVTKVKKIEEIRSEHLTSRDACQFDFEALDGRALDPDDLKKALISLPAIASRRVVNIESADKFKDRHLNIILDFARSGHDHAVVILNFEKIPAKKRLWSELSSLAKTVRFSQGGSDRNVFSVTRAIQDRNPAKALKELNLLMEEGEHPLQIMPGVVWFWGSQKRSLSADIYNKGLLVLQEADVNIKRSRLEPGHALEIAVTKLNSLIAC